MNPPLTAPSDRLEFSDSEVASLHRDERGGLQLRFAAAQVHRGDPPVRGYLAGVVLSCTGAAGDPVPADFVGRLTDGRVGREGAWQGVLPLPCTLAGPLRLELRFAGGATLALSADTLVLQADPAAAFTESLAC